jgi:hypothetical protein
MEPTEPTWEEGRPGRVVHTGCVQWSQRSFPLTAEMASLRGHWRALTAAVTAVEQAGTFVSELRRKWPTDAEEGMKEWDRTLARVQAAIERVRKL